MRNPAEPCYSNLLKLFFRGSLLYQETPISAGPIFGGQANDQPDGDGNRSLWVTMNTLEENMIRGGIKGVNERGRRISTKAVRQIDLDFRIHRGLWELAREYAEMN